MLWGRWVETIWICPLCINFRKPMTRGNKILRFDTQMKVLALWSLPTHRVVSNLNGKMPTVMKVGSSRASGLWPGRTLSLQNMSSWVSKAHKFMNSWKLQKMTREQLQIIKISKLTFWGPKLRRCESLDKTWMEETRHTAATRRFRNHTTMRQPNMELDHFIKPPQAKLGLSIYRNHNPQALV